PIVSFLMTKFCYRKIALCGSVLVTVGLLGMPFLPYIPTMCLFFGVLTGFGNCCTYIPSHVLSGLYYNKYRSIATGISTSGSGLGAAIMPVLVGFLIDVYSWKGSIIFVAGLNLHLFIFASLLRYPSGDFFQELHRREYRAKEIIVGNQDETKCLVTPKKTRNEKATLIASNPENDSPIINKVGLKDRPKSFTNNANCELDANYDNFGVNLEELDFIDKLSLRTNKNSIDNFSERLITSHGPMMISIQDADEEAPEPDIPDGPQTHSVVVLDEDGAKTYDVKLRQKKPNLQVRHKHVNDKISQEKQRISFLDVLHQNSLSSHSLFAVGSRGSHVILIDTFQQLCDLQRSLSVKEDDIVSIIPLSSRHFYIFTNYEFDIYFLSNIMWNAGYAIIQSFAPEFLQDKGLTLMEAAWLSGCFGFASFVGGIFGGAIGNVEKMNRQGIYTMATITMGVATVVFPMYKQFIIYIALLIISGLAFGVILGLLIVVLTDLVGVESLGNGLGYLMLSNGLGTFVGPPVASLLKEVTGGFEMGIQLAGALCILGGLIMLLMPCRRYCLTRCLTVPEKQQNFKMAVL
ncbi:unnamed protein product, partial [Candidula unifasciata]